MAMSNRRAWHQAEESGEAILDGLQHQLSALRKQVDQLSNSVGSYGDGSLSDFHHNALALAREMQHQGRAVSRQVGREVGRQAHVAGNVVRENPVPALVTLGTIALLSAMVFTRR